MMMIKWPFTHQLAFYDLMCSCVQHFTVAIRDRCGYELTDWVNVTPDQRKKKQKLQDSYNGWISPTKVGYNLLHL